MRRFALLISVFSIFGCQQKYQLQIAHQIAEETRLELAPDKRVAVFRIDSLQKGKPIVVLGETNLPRAKEIFFEKLKKAGIEATDKLTQLPATDLHGKDYGIVNVSVCNIRSEPKHSAELATQALLGTSLRVWKKDGDFYLIQTPDDYLGWVDDGGFVLLTEVEHQQFVYSNRAVVKNDYVFALEKPEKNAGKVADLLAGSIVQIVENRGDFTLIAFPDGRFGFVESSNIEPLGSWLSSRNATAENIIATAKDMMGRPYLWGGTSGKGMDCSGFTKMVFYLNGIQLPRDASQQVNVGELVETDTASWSNLSAGDLLFFGRPATAEKKERITHVAIYLGNSRIIHASDMVKTESLRRGEPGFAEDRIKTFIRAKRIIGEEGLNGIKKLTDIPYYQIKP